MLYGMMVRYDPTIRFAHADRKYYPEWIVVHKHFV